MGSLPERNMIRTVYQVIRKLFTVKVVDGDLA